MNTDDQIRAAIRKKLHTGVEFYVDADIIKADSIDLSETGIKFETNEPIKIRMRVDVGDGEYQENQAELVWAQKDEDGYTTYGLHFIPDKSSEDTPAEAYLKPEDVAGEWE